MQKKNLSKNKTIITLLPIQQRSSKATVIINYVKLFYVNPPTAVIKNKLLP